MQPVPNYQQYSTEGTSLNEATRDKATLAARDALERARLLQPYLSSFLNATSLIQSESIGPTFGVTPNLILIYNPLFILGMNESGEGMTQWEFGIAFLHESLHIVFKHQRRWERYRRKHNIEETQLTARQWNIAADCEINVLLRKVHPINPVYERLARGYFIGQAGLPDSYWNSLDHAGRGEAVRKLAKQEWLALPTDKRYITGMEEDWPHDGVSLPPWFCFPETALDPPQGDGGTAEDYYPFVRKPPQSPEPDG